VYECPYFFRIPVFSPINAYNSTNKGGCFCPLWAKRPVFQFLFRAARETSFRWCGGWVVVVVVVGVAQTKALNARPFANK